MTSRPVLFFDGVCGLCNRFVDFVLRHDRQHRLFLAPLQGTTAAAELPDEVIHELDTVVFLDKQRWQIRSSAVVRILWQLGGIWLIPGTLLWLIPRPLRDVAYRLIAKNRYRLFGRHETCRIPTAAERSRFLD